MESQFFPVERSRKIKTHRRQRRIRAARGRRDLLRPLDVLAAALPTDLTGLPVQLLGAAVPGVQGAVRGDARDSRP